ncbi:MAG: hypothetical protein WCD18_01945 [Thermosynechococcaceae cyanobacterium]
MKDFNKMSPEEIYAYIKRRLDEGVNFLEDEEFRKASEKLRNGRRILDTKKIEEFLRH